MLDSFDGRLRAAGPAGRAPARARARGVADRPRARRAGAAGRGRARAPRYLASELPEGPVRRRLADVLEMRALVPVVRLRCSVLPLAVVNGDGRRWCGS